MTENPPHPGSAERTLLDNRLEHLVREEPLLIQVGDQQLLTMRTPGDDLALALGFLLSEGVISAATDVIHHEFETGDPGDLRADTIRLRVRHGAEADTRGRLTRTHEVRPSCGICGLTDPDELLEDTPPLLPRTPRLARADLEKFRVDFENRQDLFRLTGASHGAALYGPDGSLLGRGEDVGRHNALDKAIGNAGRSGHTFHDATAFLSGRAGYDLAMKCLRLGIPVLLSVSAASSLSFDLYSAAGGTLVGFVRGGQPKIYCDAGRLSE